MTMNTPQTVAALAIALSTAALPATALAGASHDVSDALHGQREIDRVAVDRVERLAGDLRERGHDDLADTLVREASTPRRGSVEGRESRDSREPNETSDAGVAVGDHRWQTLSRVRDADRGQAHGQTEGRGRGQDRDGRDGHAGRDGHDGRDGRGEHHDRDGHPDRDDVELGEHGHGEHAGGHGGYHGSVTPVSPVPVPAAAWLLGLGLLGLAGLRRRPTTPVAA